MPGNVSSLASNGDRTAVRRAARRGAAILLAVAVAASGCGGDPAADEDGGQAQELGSATTDTSERDANEQGLTAVEIYGSPYHNHDDWFCYGMMGDAKERMRLRLKNYSIDRLVDEGIVWQSGDYTFCISNDDLARADEGEDIRDRYR